MLSNVRCNSAVLRLIKSKLPSLTAFSTTCHGHQKLSKDNSIVEAKPNALQKIDIPGEDGPNKLVFQQFKRSQGLHPIYTLDEAAQFAESEFETIFFRYPNLSLQHAISDYQMRGIDNMDTRMHIFPERTDICIVGSGLIGSATAYYVKLSATRTADVVVLDKDPYSPSNCTAICNGLISSQSKFREVSRLAILSKEMLRNLRNDLLVTDDDFSKIKYRPCTHLILWTADQVPEALDSVAQQIDDGIFTESKLPDELQRDFPWLKFEGSDVALGTHGNQDEAIVDPIALRNLYRTLAQARGAAFIQAEAIDFNTVYHRQMRALTSESASILVCRLPATGLLRNLGYAKTLLSLGHDTPFLEARSEMESHIRSGIGDLHFLRPKLRVNFTFQSLNSPTINFPAITDTDGSLLIRESHLGDFKYYLTYEDSEKLLDEDSSQFMDLSKENPYSNLIHSSSTMKKYFEDVIKPRLVNRIPIMEDASFLFATSGFESCNTIDGHPVMGLHPYHTTVMLSGGYGPRLMTYGPAVASILTELMLLGSEETYDLTNFYWNRCIRNHKNPEFSKLLA